MTAAARTVATIAVAMTLAAVGGCVKVESSSESFSDVDVFRLSSKDLPAGYDVLEFTSDGACAERRTSRQLKALAVTRCDVAAFANAYSDKSGRTLGRLLTYRFADDRQAAAALPRMRRSAVRSGAASPVIDLGTGEPGPARVSRHSLPVSGLGDDAPRGVRIERHANDGQLLDAVNLYLWRNGPVVAALSVTGPDETKASGATGLAGSVDPAATLRIAQRIDKRARSS